MDMYMFSCSFKSVFVKKSLWILSRFGFGNHLSKHMHGFWYATNILPKYRRVLETLDKTDMPVPLKLFSFSFFFLSLTETLEILRLIDALSPPTTLDSTKIKLPRLCPVRNMIRYYRLQVFPTVCAWCYSVMVFKRWAQGSSFICSIFTFDSLSMATWTVFRIVLARLSLGSRPLTRLAV